MNFLEIDGKNYSARIFQCADIIDFFKQLEITIENALKPAEQEKLNDNQGDKRKPLSKKKEAQLKKRKRKNNEFYEGIAGRLTKARESLNLAPRQMAALLQIANKDYQDLEDGKNVITSRAYYTLNKSLSISIDWLISGIGPMFTNRIFNFIFIEAPKTNNTNTMNNTVG